jgi:signal transduction histidine kinase
MYRLAKEARNEGELASKLIKLIDLEKKIGIQKDNFMMLSSHYLRTPLTIIRSGIDLLFTLEKTEENRASLVKAASGSLNTRVESIFSDINANTYLNNIKTPNIKEEKVKIYTSFYLWLPIVLIGLVAFLADYLFLTVAKININVINLITEIIAFIILAQFFFSLYRKRANERIKNQKYEKDYAEQRVIDDARNNFMKMVVIKLNTAVDSLEAALHGIGKPQNKKEILKGLDDLKQMIKKFGFLGQLTANKVNFDYNNVNLAGIIVDCEKQKAIQIKTKNLQMILPATKLSLRTDKDKLMFVLENVIDNAIKFSKENGKINISWKENNGEVNIVIEDDGVGISEEAKELLFRPFVRGTSTLQFDYEGMGTNLYIAKMLTNYLGGDISVESELGKGTKVTVFIDTEPKQK